MVFGSLILEVDKLSSKTQAIDHLLTNPKAHDSLSKCKVAMLKVRYEGGNDTKQFSIYGKPKNA